MRLDFIVLPAYILKNKREEKQYEVHSVSKFEKYNRHRNFL